MRKNLSRTKKRSWASKRGRKRMLNNIFSSKIFQKFKKLNWKKIFKFTALSAMAGFFVGSIIFLGLFAWYSRDLPDPNTIMMREVAQSTKIFDRTGEHLLYEISGDQRRTLVELQDIPDFVIQTTLTAEDRKFYEHRGIDFRGIVRAFLVNVTTRRRAQGASTITQQLVKNAILTNERTYSRKMKELILALALERRYTKDEIIQLYLNEIPYGSTNYGIESASRAYFNKSVQELTLAEAATLAALPRAPSTYLNNPDRLLARRDWILVSMYELGHISEDKMNEALNEETPVALRLTNIKAPHFVLWVKEQLEREYGEAVVERGGLNVITTIDLEKQNFAEEAVRENVAERGERYGFNNSGLVSLDPKTGEILAMVGSANFFDREIDGQVNVMLRPLQPGSSIKPLIYAAGFEQGYTPNTLLWDVNTTFSTITGPYSPRNFDGRERGPISIRSALQGSMNTTAVKMLYLIGVDRGIDFLERFGYTTFSDRSRFGLAIVLGGGEVIPLEHATAFSTFANDGIKQRPVSVLKVTRGNNEVLFEHRHRDGERVIEANIARMTNNVMADDAARAFVFGAGGNLTIPGRQVAAKTGTTNDAKDAWTVGYTPNLVTVVWSGNTRGQLMRRGAGGSTVAAPVWNSFMRRALAEMPSENFPSPQIPETGKNILDGIIPTQSAIISTISGKLATPLTPEIFREEKVCGEYHNILHYVRRSDPWGDIPQPEERDLAYESWESAVQDFIQRFNENLSDGQVPFEACELPTEYDDIHIPENEPQVSIMSPQNNESVAGNFNVAWQGFAPRGINRFEILINDQLISSGYSTDNTNINLPSWLDAGRHRLTVALYDDVKNRGIANININTSEVMGIRGYRLRDPINNQVIELNGENYTISLHGSDPGAERVRVEVRNIITAQTSTIGMAENPQGSIIIDWENPISGAYYIYAITEFSSGEVVQSPMNRITVRNN